MSLMCVEASLSFSTWEAEASGTLKSIQADWFQNKKTTTLKTKVLARCAAITPTNTW